MIGDRLDLSALEPHWQRLRTWWSARSLREQVLLGALTAIGIIALLLVLVVNPLRDARADALSRIRTANLLEARLRNGGDSLASGGFRTGTVSAIVTNSTAAANLKVATLEAQGANSVVTLEDAPFNAVMTWIADLESSSRLTVRDATIESKGAPGLVTATVVVGE